VKDLVAESVNPKQVPPSRYYFPYILFLFKKFRDFVYEIIDALHKSFFF
jgi:hypothetical protein